MSIQFDLVSICAFSRNIKSECSGLALIFKKEEDFWQMLYHKSVGLLLEYFPKFLISLPQIPWYYGCSVSRPSGNLPTMSQRSQERQSSQELEAACQRLLQNRDSSSSTRGSGQNCFKIPQIMLACCFCSVVHARLWCAKASASVLCIGGNGWEIWFKPKPNYSFFFFFFTCFVII